MGSNPVPMTSLTTTPKKRSALADTQQSLASFALKTKSGPLVASRIIGRKREAKDEKRNSFLSTAKPLFPQSIASQDCRVRGA